MKTVLLLALAACASAQIVIDAAGPGDFGFSNSSVWALGTPGYEDLGAPPWATLRYSPNFSYSIPVPNGFYVVDLGLMEPNKTGPGQRVFTVTANGSASAPLDLFKLSGLKQQYTLTMFATVNTGILKLDFRATLGNAVVSSISVRPFASSTNMELVIETVDIITGTALSQFKLAKEPYQGRGLYAVQSDTQLVLMSTFEDVSVSGIDLPEGARKVTFIYFTPGLHSLSEIQ